ncbi:MAG: glucose-6-phosphate isomerase, partial [Acidimicrobiaceae bacterium]|nr:glucose-6-phosphate isomerase [Acidimicrobiaceae bacterium]
MESLSFERDDLFFDFSKQFLADKTLHLLVDLASHAGLEEKITGMFEGEIVNQSEERPALHTALRMSPTTQVNVDGEDVIPLIQAAHEKASDFALRVRA